MTTTIEQMVLQLQQELFTLKAQVAARLQIAAAALEWSAEQVTEISTEFIDREFLPIMTNQERGVKNLEFILQQMHTMLTDLTSDEANDMVANSRKNPLEAWRRLQKRYDPTTGGCKRILLRTFVSLGRCSPLEFQAGIKRWESAVSQYEKMSENKDERRDQVGWHGSVGTGGAGETPDSQLQSHSNFRGCTREVVKYVEAKFGLTIRDSKPSDTGEHSEVGAVNSPTSVEEKGSSVSRVGCFTCEGAHFQRDYNASKNAGKKSKSGISSNGTGLYH